MFVWSPLSLNLLALFSAISYFFFFFTKRSDYIYPSCHHCQWEPSSFYVSSFHPCNFSFSDLFLTFSNIYVILNLQIIFIQICACAWLNTQYVRSITSQKQNNNGFRNFNIFHAILTSGRCCR